jgi:hypothetical protein
MTNNINLHGFRTTAQKTTLEKGYWKITPLSLKAKSPVPG